MAPISRDQGTCAGSTTERMLETGLGAEAAAPFGPADLPLAGLPHSTHPAWLRVVRRIHDSGPGLTPALADAAVLAAAGLGLRLPPVVVAVFSVLAPVVLYIGGHYVPRSPLVTQGISWYPTQILRGYLPATVGLVAVAGPLTREPQAALLGVVGFGLLVLVRALTWTVLSAARRRGLGLVPTAVLGSGAPAGRVMAKLRAYPEVGLLPTMVLGPVWEEGPIGATWDPEEAALALRSGDIRQLIVIPDGNPEQDLREYLGHVDDLDVALVPPLAELFLAPGRRVCRVGGLPLIPLGRWSAPNAPKPGKRAFDVLLSGLLILLLSPVLLAAALAVRLGGGPGPVIYRQRRVGFGGRTFEIFKFRTMEDGADQALIDLTDQNAADGLLFKVLDDPRVTAVGQVLRRFSIDELPQLFNVFKGQMSLVGPRPLAVEPGSFGDLDHRRHSVRPGITGYWQVAGGNGLTYQEMIQLDLAYIDGWSLGLDVLLLVQTVPALVNRRGPW